MNNIIVCGTGRDSIKYLWKDSIESNIITFVDFNYPKTKSLIYRYIFSNKTNTRFNFKIKALYRKRNFVFEAFLKQNYNNIVIFSDLIPTIYDYKYFDILRKNTI